MKSNNFRSSVAFSAHTKLSFKVIVVGDSAVGKTSLVVRQVKGIFNKNYTVSLGVEFYSKIMQVQGQILALQIWDTAGQQAFKSVVKSFYNKASCVIITYSKPELLKQTMENYILEINEYALEGVRVVVARTKCDNIRPKNRDKSWMTTQKDSKLIFGLMLVQRKTTMLMSFLLQLWAIFIRDIVRTHSLDKYAIPRKTLLYQRIRILRKIMAAKKSKNAVDDFSPDKG